MESQPDLDLNAPDVLWAGAFWYWRHHGGDMRIILQLLRDGVPLPPAEAQVLADIIEGKLRRRCGPTPAAQDRKRRQEDHVRACFRVLMEEFKASGRYRRGMHASARLDAIEKLARDLSMSSSNVKRIVDVSGAKPPKKPRWIL